MKERCLISAWSKVELEINDVESLKQALIELGYHPEIHEEIQSLFARSGKKMPSKYDSNIIVRYKECSSVAWGDLGFRKENGKYTLVSDLFPREKKQFVGSVKQLYGKYRVIKQVKKLGFRLSSQKIDKKGCLKIRLMAP